MATRETGKIPMTEADLRDRRLTIDTTPQVKGDRIIYAPRKSTDAGKVNRFYLDDAPGNPRNLAIPKGMGVRVGKHDVVYELSRRGPKGFRRAVLGSVHELTLAEAVEKANAYGKVIAETGENPRDLERIQAREDADKVSTQDITIGHCMARYIANLEERLGRGKIKPSTVREFKNAKKRLDEVLVGGKPVADLIVRDIDEDLAKKIYHAVRLNGMRRSNKIPTQVHEALAGTKDYATLSTRKLEEIGVTGKMVALVRAGGMAVAESTVSAAIRSVDLVLKRELANAQREGRPPHLLVNSLRAVYDAGLFRRASELREHYRRAQVRNPLGQENESLARVLKAIVGRRDAQGGHNRAGADYLLLTLLWGGRRSEAARLQWWDLANKAEREQEEVSWVWLGEPDEIHPLTRMKGSQVFFHDTKNNQSRFVPICHFAEQVLLRRLDEREETLRRAPDRIKAARAAHRRVRQKTNDKRKLIEAKRKIFIETSRVKRAVWVFPARSSAAKLGHYVDSKAIIQGVRKDAGLSAPDVDIGLTPHDLRRTLGRYAESLYGGGTLVSQMLHHTVKTEGEERSSVTERYTLQEWSRLREAFGKVEETIIASSPRVWNRLRGTSKQMLDESNDPPLSGWGWGEDGNQAES